MYPIISSGMTVAVNHGQALLESFCRSSWKGPTGFLLQELQGSEMSILYKDLCYWKPKPAHPTGANTDAERWSTNSFSTPVFKWIWIGDHSVQVPWPTRHVKAGISKVPQPSLEHCKRTRQGSRRGYQSSDNFAIEIQIFILQEVLMTQISLMGSFYRHT